MHDAKKYRCKTWQLQKSRGLKTRQNERTDFTRTNTMFLHELQKVSSMNRPAKSKNTCFSFILESTTSPKNSVEFQSLWHQNGGEEAPVKTNLPDKPFYRVPTCTMRKGLELLPATGEHQLHGNTSSRENVWNFETLCRTCCAVVLRAMTLALVACGMRCNAPSHNVDEISRAANFKKKTHRT